MFKVQRKDFRRNRQQRTIPLPELRGSKSQSNRKNTGENVMAISIIDDNKMNEQMEQFVQKTLGLMERYKFQFPDALWGIKLLEIEIIKQFEATKNE